MKKILPLVLLIVGVVSNAQTEKKEPPPPPPKPKEEVKYKVVKDEKVKVSAPKVVDEKIKVKEPPPPPPPKSKDEVVKYEVMIDEKVDASKPEEPPVITVRGKLADDFYKRNPSVTGISRRENVITIKKKDGTIEKYDMSKKEEDKNFTEKYGRSPIPPPPPPPKKIS
jgi:hypothetical protein